MFGKIPPNWGKWPPAHKFDSEKCFNLLCVYVLKYEWLIGTVCVKVHFQFGVTLSVRFISVQWLGTRSTQGTHKDDSVTVLLQCGKQYLTEVTFLCSFALHVRYSSCCLSNWEGQYFRHIPKQPWLPDRFFQSSVPGFGRCKGVCNAEPWKRTCQNPRPSVCLGEVSVHIWFWCLRSWSRQWFWRRICDQLACISRLAPRHWFRNRWIWWIHLKNPVQEDIA